MTSRRHCRDSKLKDEVSTCGSSGIRQPFRHATTIASNGTHEECTSWREPSNKEDEEVEDENEDADEEQEVLMKKDVQRCETVCSRNDAQILPVSIE
jgi:hypothetical protein